MQSQYQPPPMTWANLQKQFRLAYSGGHDDDVLRRAFHCGMDTVFNVLEGEFPPAAMCKAAPDLLAACKALVKPVDDRDEYERAIDLGRAAIAKAKGTDDAT